MLHGPGSFFQFRRLDRLVCFSSPTKAARPWSHAALASLLRKSRHAGVARAITFLLRGQLGLCHSRVVGL
jgi:hypothetical protein